jgi:Secretion system C-terminal sorting domain
MDCRRPVVVSMNKIIFSVVFLFLAIGWTFGQQRNNKTAQSFALDNAADRGKTSIHSAAKPMLLDTNIRMLTVCENRTYIDLDTLLAVNDPDTNKIVSWEPIISPQNGSAVVSYNSVTHYDTLYPIGLFYIAKSNYFGGDTFSVSISDGVTHDTVIFYININKAPDIGSITGIADVCMGADITLSDSVSGGIWSLTNSNATIVSGIVHGVTGGRDTVVYAISDSLCSSSTTFPFTVSVFPNIDTLIGADSFCFSSTDTFRCAFWAATNQGIWKTQKPNVYINEFTDFVLAVGADSGTNIITYLDSNACGVDSAQKIVYSIPYPIVDTIIGPDTLCIGTAEHYTGVANGYYGLWSISNKNLAKIDSFGNLTATSEGSFSVTYTTVGQCGNIASLEKVNVLTKPNSAAIVGQNIVCEGQRIRLRSTVTGGHWDVTNSNATVDKSDSGVVQGWYTGTDTVLYVLKNYCGSDSVLFPVTVDALPVVPEIHRWVNRLWVDSVYSTYQWTVNGDKIPGASLDSITAVKFGLYQVTVSNQAGCTEISDFYDISSLAACLAEDISFFPNPAHDKLNVVWCAPVRIKIYNLNGTPVLECNDNNVINVSKLLNGVYIVSFFDGNGNYQKSGVFTKL